MAVTASTSSWPSVSSSRMRRRALPRHRGRSLADHTDPGDRAVGESRGDVGRQCDVADGRSSTLPSTIDDLAAQGLGEAERRLGDLLQQEVRRVATVDVARRDLGGDHVAGTDRVRRFRRTPNRWTPSSVPAVSPDTTTISPPCSPSIRMYVLVSSTTPYGSLATIVQSSAEPDVHALTAAAQGEEERARHVGARHADRHRPFERADGAAERLDGIDTGRQMTCHERRDHLRVGRDRCGDAQPVRGPQVGVVVDVTVQRGNDVRRPSSCRVVPSRSSSTGACSAR